MQSPFSARNRPMLLAGLLLVVVSATILISVFACTFYPLRFDEPYFAWSVKRVAMGQVPHVDFHIIEPPLVLYGPALFFKIFGASIGGLRILTIVWLLMCTMLLYVILVREGLHWAWAAAGSLLFPASFVPFWPVASHHWFAAGMGLITLLVGLEANRKPSAARLFATGAMVAATGLTLQSDGLIVTSAMILLFAVKPPPKNALRLSLWGLAGIATPLLLAIVALLAQHALAPAFYDMVVIPYLDYKPPGGFNDVSLKGLLLESFTDMQRHGNGIQSMLAGIHFFGVAVFPWLVLILLLAAPSFLGKDRSRLRESIWGVVSALVALWVYSKGRTDLVRLLLFAYFFWVFAAHSIDWRSERVRPTVFKAWILVMLLLNLTHWPAYWIKHPPLISAVLATDAYRKEQSSAAVVRFIPGVIEKRLPVVALPHGCSLYFYWAPDPPPFDWTLPPSDLMYAPGDFETVANFIEGHKIPYILLEKDDIAKRDYARDFLKEPSAIRLVLKKSYRPMLQTPWGLVFERTSQATAAPVEQPRRDGQRLHSPLGK